MDPERVGMLSVWAAENDTREVRRAAVYFILSGFFGNMIDLVSDYAQEEVNDGCPYLYIFAGPIVAPFELSPMCIRLV